MKVRINNIECRKYNHVHKDREVMYELILWTPNTYYGREKEYRDLGWTDSFGGNFLRNESGSSIPISAFELKETCIVVAWLKLNRSEPDVYLESVGSRILELDKEDLRDFFDVYEIAHSKIFKKHFKC